MEETLRECAACEDLLPLGEFRKNARCKDGRTPKCKRCLTSYDKLGWENRGDRRPYFKKARARANRRWVYEFLQSHPCVDCEDARIPVLQFDHVDPKTKIATVAHLLSAASLEKVRAEIDKCEVRCANCHTMRTAEQQGWYDWMDEEDPPEWKPRAKKERDCGDWLKYKEGCRCDPCRKANTDYHREYRKNRVAKAIAASNLVEESPGCK